ncbi:hypothetical protein [Chthonomonas calidirosea]|nr:hypothetical protein [Chthonomonas calidirosea]
MRTSVLTTYSQKRIGRSAMLVIFALLACLAGALLLPLLVHSFQNPNTLLTRAHELTSIHPESGEIYAWLSADQVVFYRQTAPVYTGGVLPIRTYDLTHHLTTPVPTNALQANPSLLAALGRSTIEVLTSRAQLALYQASSPLLPSNLHVLFNTRHQYGFGSLLPDLHISFSVTLTPPAPPIPPGTTLIGYASTASDSRVYLTQQPLPAPMFLRWLKRIFPKLPNPQKTLFTLWLYPQHSGQLQKLGELVVNTPPKPARFLVFPTDPLDLRTVPGGKAVSFVYNHRLYYLPLPTNAAPSSVSNTE